MAVKILVNRTSRLKGVYLVAQYVDSAELIKNFLVDYSMKKFANGNEDVDGFIEKLFCQP